MSERPSKRALKEQLVAALSAELAVLERAHDASREAATHEEAKPENDKDTRALEQSYVARGQALRIEQMRSDLADAENMPSREFGAGDPVALSAVVIVEEGDRIQAFFVAPSGGGTSLHDGKIQVVTPKSPLGRALVGKRRGDGCELAMGGKVRELSLVEVS
ncbi:MAG TPA: hypothetical protein VJT73_06130 [Polyangiaceae bacterium]|nr:hypothetical protein [Polyangiaceae bacterium]